jgi:hypothetical protein
MSRGWGLPRNLGLPRAPPLETTLDPELWLMRTKWERTRSQVNLDTPCCRCQHLEPETDGYRGGDVTVIDSVIGRNKLERHYSGSAPALA